MNESCLLRSLSPCTLHWFVDNVSHAVAAMEARAVEAEAEVRNRPPASGC